MERKKVAIFDARLQILNGENMAFRNVNFAPKDAFSAPNCVFFKGKFFGHAKI